MTYDTVPDYLNTVIYLNCLQINFLNSLPCSNLFLKLRIELFNNKPCTVHLSADVVMDVSLDSFLCPLTCLWSGFFHYLLSICNTRLDKIYIDLSTFYHEAFNNARRWRFVRNSWPWIPTWLFFWFIIQFYTIVL